MSILISKLGEQENITKLQIRKIFAGRRESRQNRIVIHFCFGVICQPIFLHI